MSQSLSQATTTAPEPAPENGTGPAVGDTPAAPPVPAAPPTPRKPRRVLRAVGRWTAAVAAFGLFGTAVAYGITEVDRGDLPGLATKSDGRWDYPDLALPALPPGAPPPYEAKNKGQVHHANIRDLLVPVPEGATADDALPALEGEWVPEAEFATIYVKEDRDDIEQRLADDAVRHIAARGFAMPDGTRTRVYLLQFNSGMYTEHFFSSEISTGVSPWVEVRGAPNATFDEDWPEDAAIMLDSTILVHSFDEPKPRGDQYVRQAYVLAGDTLAVVVQSREKEAPDVPFQQTVLLQARLLR